VKGEGEEEEGDEGPAQGKNSGNGKESCPPIATGEPVGGRDHDKVGGSTGGEESGGCLEETGRSEEEEEGQEPGAGTEASGDAVDEGGFAGGGDEGEEDAEAVED